MLSGSLHMAPRTIRAATGAHAIAPGTNAEIKHSDWMFQFTLLFLTNQRALFLRNF